MHIHHSAQKQIDAIDTLSTSDATEERLIARERGWVECLAHLSERGMLTASGQDEAAEILDASREWAEGLRADETLLMPVVVVVDGS